MEHIPEISERTLTLNESVTFVVARILRNGWLRYRSPERDREWQTTIQRFPCRTSIRDVYIRDDVFGDIGCQELPQLREVMQHVFERSGWDASRFRVYRTRVVYPPPMVSLTWWLRLPEAPP